VIEAEGVQQGRVPVIMMHRINDGFVAEFIRLAVDMADLELAAGDLLAEAEATPIPPELEQQLAFRDLSHILGQEQVVLLHPRGRHELSHVRAFRERVVAVLG
jgi:hypothetical protein